MSRPQSPRWLLALESSTAHGGAALARDGEIVGTRRLAEGLRHGRELLPAAAALLREAGLAAGDLAGVAVSSGPGSYTGTRVGVMAAKALAYGAGCGLVAVSSLAAMAYSLALEGLAHPGDAVFVAQDARRDEVFVGRYRLADGDAPPLADDVAVTPEEAGTLLGAMLASGVRPVVAGSGFATYPEVFADPALPRAETIRVHPGAVGILAWRQFLLNNLADPLVLQPSYLRRDPDADWRHDSLIARA